MAGSRKPGAKKPEPLPNPPPFPLAAPVVAAMLTYAKRVYPDLGVQRASFKITLDDGMVIESQFPDEDVIRRVVGKWQRWKKQNKKPPEGKS